LGANSFLSPFFFYISFILISWSVKLLGLISWSVKLFGLISWSVKLLVKNVTLEFKILFKKIDLIVFLVILEII